LYSITKFELAWELYRAGLKPEAIGERVDRDRATVYRWIAKIKIIGIREFIRIKKECKRRRQKRKVISPVSLKIREIRSETGWCGQKIAKELLENHGVKISVPTVYRVLHGQFKLGAASKPHKPRGETPKATGPREVIQHDTVDFGGLFAHTSIDVFTKEPAVVMVENLESATGIRAFAKQKAFYGKTSLHHSDEGSEFKGEYPARVEASGSKHRFSRPYKKNDQSYIESFNRSLRKECLGWVKYRKEEKWEIQKLVNEYTYHFINKRWHMGLPNMMTPAQFKLWYTEKRKVAKVVAFAP
jgi:transposase InsO family protein